jgi:hypothetical protein
VLSTGFFVTSKERFQLLLKHFFLVVECGRKGDSGFSSFVACQCYQGKYERVDVLPSAVLQV